MRRIPGAARVVRMLVMALSLAPLGGAIRSAGAQDPARIQDPRLRQLLEEWPARSFAMETRETIAAARKNWREGRYEDAVTMFEKGLEQARKILGERPNTQSVDILETLARVHESKGSFAAAVAEIRRALDIQTRLTGPKSWEVVELESEIGRLDRLGKLRKDQLEVLSRLEPTVALVATANGPVALAVCIDPRGLFLTRARPLGNLWMSSKTHFEYDEKSHALIGLRTEYNTSKKQAMFVVFNPGRPDETGLHARVVRTSGTEDLALLAVTSAPTRPLAAMELVRSHEPEIGAEVTTLNHWNAPVRSYLDSAEPIFLRACPSTIAAVRSSKNRPWLLQLDAMLPAGGTEGPVVDGRGRLLGFAMKGLPGTGVSYTISSRVIEELLGKAVLLARPPVVSYRERKREHDWSIPLWVAASEAPAEVAVEITFGEGPSRRTFGSTTAAGRPGVFLAKVVPVDPAEADHVDLLVGRSQGVTRYTVEDREVSVGPTKLRLSELRRLELGREPKGFAADGRPLAGVLGGFDGLKAHAEGVTAPVDLQDASSLDVVYLPESVEPIPGELVVRSRGEVRHREPFPVRIREPLVDLGGVLDVSRTSASGDPSEAPSPTRLGDDQVIALDGEISEVTVGAGGRYLFLTLRKRKELVVFDAYSQRIAARIPVASDEVLIAAGADAAFLVYPSLRIIHRWDLRRMALDRTAKLPIRGDAKTVALGSASTSPILIRWTERQLEGEFTDTKFSFIDPRSLKVLTVASFGETSDIDQSDHSGGLPDPGVFRLEQFYSGEEEVNLRVSPRGDVFGLWRSNMNPEGFCILSLRGSAARAFHIDTSFGHLIPGQDGRTVFTGTGGRLDLEGKPQEHGETQKALPRTLAPSNQPPPAPTRLIPSAEAAYYLALKGLRIQSGSAPSKPSIGTKAVIAFQALGLDRPLGELEVSWQTPGPVPMPAPGADPPRRVHIDQRFHWVPAADLLIVIPPTDDRLILRRVPLDEMLGRLGEESLFVSSPRGVDVILGRPFRHVIEAQSGRGRPEFTLSKGPIGLQLAPGGELTWEDPAGSPGDEVKMEFKVQNASGRTVQEVIVLRLLTTGSAAQ